MLKSLFIKNVALIDEVRISFSEGFNVFTGETGAGKSILIGSIGLLLGDKTDKSIIKNGCEFAKVEGLFEVQNKNDNIKHVFEELGLEFDSEIIISRIIKSTNKSEFRINGEQVTMNMFKKVSSNLIDIFGQHDNQNLLNSSNHIEYLDNFIGAEVDNIKDRLYECCLVISSINKKIGEFGGDERLRAREIELLSYEIKQIEDAELKADEEEILLNRKRVLINSEKIYTTLSSAIDSMSNNNNLVGVVKDIVTGLSTISAIDDKIDESKERLQSVRWELEDIENTLSNIVSSINYSEKELNDIEDRLDVINDLKRKYGNTVEEILLYLSNSKEKLEKLCNCDLELEELNKKKEVMLKEYYELSKSLSSIRVEKAKGLEHSIVAELQDLGMKSAKFCVDIYFPTNEEFLQSATISKNGLDKVEFLFSANLGEVVRPLNKIISGGELSRFSLAFKTILNIEDSSKTLIFDEIDAGIGGNTGSVVAKKIVKISKRNQILCITHLAQIASFADSHYKIYKFEADDRTYTTVNVLNQDDKQSEISRMIGSIENKSYADMHSLELLNEASIYKQSL